MKEIVLATRGSRLALAQTEIVKRRLERFGVHCKILTVKTKGDKDRKSALSAIGGNGLFVREIEAALLSGEADLAVHSAKDLPYELADGLTVPCVPEAGDSRECFLCVRDKVFGAHPVVGTGSARRREQAKLFFPIVTFAEIRGNVDTRLKKLLAGEYDAIMLAKAGLDRLKPDLSPFDVCIFSPDEIIPAACQGLLAVECRRDDSEMLSLLAKINDEEAFLRFQAERTVLSLLNADCQAVVGVYSELDGEKITVTAFYEGRRATASGNKNDWEAVCHAVSEELYEQK